MRLHGLTGRATEEVLQRMGREFKVERPADADKASVLGGLLSGALGGLAADLGAGGLTFGAGALHRRRARGLRRARARQGLQPGACELKLAWFAGPRFSLRTRRRRPDPLSRGGAFRACPRRFRFRRDSASLAARRSLVHCRPVGPQLEDIWAASAGHGSGSRLSSAASSPRMLLPCLSSSAREVLIELYPDSAGVFG